MSMIKINLIRSPSFACQLRRSWKNIQWRAETLRSLAGWVWLAILGRAYLHALLNTLLSGASPNSLRTGAVARLNHMATCGNIDAQYMVACLYEYGRHGVPKDREQAVQWYEQAARQGDERSACRLSEIYFHGASGIPIDYGKAFHWCAVAGGNGYYKAQNNLGSIYFSSLGLEAKNDHEYKYLASVWYRKSAIRGYNPAQLTLSIMHFRGNGIPQDLPLAYAWIRMACEGHEDLQLLTNWESEIIAAMTPSQIAQGESLLMQLTEEAGKFHEVTVCEMY